MLRWSLQLHKWIALVVGVQVLFWVLGGLVMTAIPIERVRSEHHVAEARPQPLAFDAVLAPDKAAAVAGVRPVEATLKTTPRGPLWVFRTADKATLAVDARTGRPVPPLTGPQAREAAAGVYAGEGRPVAARYFKAAPQETGKDGPLWRVDFDDAERTSFYVAPDTGEVVSRRSDLWRFYDFFWRLHIMDLKTGEDFNHPLLIAATALTLFVVLTGFILLWIRLARDFRTRRTDAAAP